MLGSTVRSKQTEYQTMGRAILLDDIVCFVGLLNLSFLLEGINPSFLQTLLLENSSFFGGLLHLLYVLQ